MATYSMPEFWLGMILLTVFAVALGWFPVGEIEDPSSTATGLAKLPDQAQHMFLPALTLTLAYLGEYAIVMRSSLLETMREDYQCSPARRASATCSCATGTRCRTRSCRSSPCSRSTSASFCRARSRLRRSSPWPGLGLATYEALKGPDLPMLQGMFLVFSASVIFFNLVADLLYGYLDPRVRPA